MKGKPKEIPQNPRNSLIISEKESYLLAGRWQGGFKVGCALCEIGCYEAAKKRVG